MSVPLSEVANGTLFTCTAVQVRQPVTYFHGTITLIWGGRGDVNLLSTYCGLTAGLTKRLNSVLNVKTLVGTFNLEKPQLLVGAGAFSVIVETDGSFAALVGTL